MTDLVQYGLARVKVVLREPDKYDGSKFNKRPPQVGDIETITDILQALGAPDHLIVEMLDPSSGTTIWLSEFEREELEPVRE